MTVKKDDYIDYDDDINKNDIEDDDYVNNDDDDTDNDDDDIDDDEDDISRDKIISIVSSEDNDESGV